MDLIARSGTRSSYLKRLTAPEGIGEAFHGAAFPCLVWDAHADRTSEERHVLVASLMEAGCRYLVCGGPGCTAWEQAGDEAFVMATFGLHVR
jgi:hypothetical protein